MVWYGVCVLERERAGKGVCNRLIFFLLFVLCVLRVMLLRAVCGWSSQYALLFGFGSAENV